MGNTRALIRNVGELVLDFGRKVPKGTNITYIWKIEQAHAITQLTAFETHGARKQSTNTHRLDTRIL